MDEKNKVFRYALDHKSFDVVIGAIPGWYMENTRIPEYVDSFSGFPLHKDADGYLNFSSPHAGGTNQAPWIAIADDLGDMIHGLFLNPNPYNGRAVQMFSDYITFEEMTVAFQKGASPVLSSFPDRPPAIQYSSLSICSLANKALSHRAEIALRSCPR